MVFFRDELLKRCFSVAVLLCALYPSGWSAAADLPDPVIAGSDEWLRKVGADNPAQAGREDTHVGAEHNPTGNPIGGGTGYSDIFTPDQADVVVDDADGFLEALEKAAAGTVIYVADEAAIDLTPFDNLTIPAGVTIAGGRGRNGSEGGLIYTYTVKSMVLLRTGGPDIRVTGLRLEGPYPGRERLTQRPRLIGISHPNVEVDNCEIFAWSCAAVSVGSGATEGAWIHHNYIHHNQRNGLGYGVSLGRTHVLIEGNLFDFCRHAIASSGTPGSGYTARYNVHLENTISHVFDMHGARDFEKYRLVGLWHFDEGRGRTTNDSSIYNGDHDGRLMNMDEDAWVEGRIGQGIRFDGIDDYVDVGKQRQLSPERGLTFSAWIWPESLTGTRAVFSKADTGERGSGYSLRLVDGELEGALYRRDGSRTQVRGGTPRTREWQHLAMRWNGKMLSIFIDGERVGETACPDHLPSPNNLLFGRDSATDTAFFHGIVDEVRLYGSGNSDDDIRRLAAGHGDIAGRLILMHHNTIRPTNHAALTVRGRPSVGCWVHHNRFDAPEGANVILQTNATGNMHVSDNQYLGRGLTAAPVFSAFEPLGLWQASARTASVIPDASGEGLNAMIRGTAAEGTPSWADSEDRLPLRAGECWIEVPEANHDARRNRVIIGLRMRVDDLRPHQELFNDGLFRLFHRGAWAGNRLYFLMRITEDTRAGESSWNHYVGVRSKRAVNQGEWFDVVCERIDNTLRIYLNGMLESEMECAAGLTPAVQSQGVLRVGQQIDGALETLWLRASQPEPEETAASRGSRMLTLPGDDGYRHNGVHPEAARADEAFTFRVRYRDADGREPAVGFPRLEILRQGKTYVNAGPVTMMALDQSSVRTGRLYTYSMRLPRGSEYQHVFEVETEDGVRSTTRRFDGPDVTSGSFAPVLSWTSQPGYVRDGVEPEIGDVSTEFDFRILFSDLDGDPPAEGFPRVHVLKGDEEIEGSPFVMQPMNDRPTWEGRPYQFRTRLAAGSDYRYYFTARDTDGNDAPQSLTRRSPTVDRAADVAPPDLSRIGVHDVHPTEATVRWTTDEPATAFVHYGYDLDYGHTIRRQELDTRHSLKLQGLVPGRTVHYRVGAVDPHGNEALSGDYTFVTPAE